MSRRRDDAARGVASIDGERYATRVHSPDAARDATPPTACMRVPTTPTIGPSSSGVRGREDGSALARLVENDAIAVGTR